MSETLNRQIACIEREIDKRNRHYPTWVEQGRISQQLADEEIQAMHGVLRTLQFMQRWEGVIRSAVEMAKKEIQPFQGRLDIDTPNVKIKERT